MASIFRRHTLEPNVEHFFFFFALLVRAWVCGCMATTWGGLFLQILSRTGDPAPQRPGLRPPPVRHGAHDGEDRGHGDGDLAVHAGTPGDHAAAGGTGADPGLTWLFHMLLLGVTFDSPVRSGPVRRGRLSAADFFHVRGCSLCTRPILKLKK